MGVQVAHTGLCQKIFFDREYRAVLDEIHTTGNLPYPPQNVTAADDLYNYLRQEMQRREEAA